MTKISEDIKITFRPHDQSDIPYRVKWLNDREINLYVGGNGESEENTSVEKQQEWFNKYSSNESKKFYTISARMKPIGIVGLSHIDYIKKEASLFIIIGEKEFQSRGIGKKAVKYIIDYGFNILGLSTIVSEVYEKNISAIKCYQSAGFLKHKNEFDNDESSGHRGRMISMKIVSVRS